jgi:hypothetical protein
MFSFWLLKSRGLLIHTSPQIAATGIVALFSGLSAASTGAHDSLRGLLSMLSAMRCVYFCDT